MDFPIKNGGSFNSYVKLPEGILKKKTASTGQSRPKCCPPGALGATTCRAAESSLRGDVETLPGGAGYSGAGYGRVTMGLTLW